MISHGNMLTLETERSQYRKRSEHGWRLPLSGTHSNHEYIGNRTQECIYQSIELAAMVRHRRYVKGGPAFLPGPGTTR